MNAGEAITAHDNTDCPLCVGASVYRDDHYALGKLRIRICAELGHDRRLATEIPLNTLLAEWRKSKERSNG